MTGPLEAAIRGEMWIEAEGLLCGYAIDDRNPAERIAIEIFADGEPVALLRAEQGLAIDADRIGGDGCHGFTFPIPATLLAQARRFVARVANRHDIVGAVDVDGRVDTAGSRPVSPGIVTWRGGTRLSGHVPRERDGDPVPTVRAVIAGIEVARVACRGWVQLDHGGVARRFDIDLPAAYADGRVRSVEVLASTGASLIGSPCKAIAYPDPLADWIEGWAELHSEKLRVRFAEGLLPRTLPFSEIDGWLERFPLPSIDGKGSQRVAVVAMGREGWEATLASLCHQPGVGWRASALPTTGSPVEFDRQDFLDLLDGELADCPLVIVTVAGTRFAPGALAWFVEAAERYPQASAVYSDILMAAPDGRCWPLAFPAFDPDLFLERGYCGFLYAMKRQACLDSSDQEPSLFGMFPASRHGSGETCPVHIPFPLATVPHLRGSQLSGALASATRARLAADGEMADVVVGTASGAASVRVRRSTPPAAVSVVLAIRDEPAALARTLLTLERVSGRGVHEVVIVDNESSDPHTIDLLARAEAAGHRIIRVPGWFCLARLLQRGADISRGDHLLFLEAGIAGSDGWLEEMLSRSTGDDIGAVGALVSWTSGIVRDAGYVIGPRFSLAPRFTDHMVGDLAYDDLLATAHGCSALSSACLLTSSALFRSLGGFDCRNFPRHLFAPDYCLRVGAARQRVILTPHAQMTVTDPSPTSGRAPLTTPGREREARVFFEKWTAVPGCDPLYSPWLAMDGVPYSGLAWPPAPFRLRAGERPEPSVFPFGL